MGRGGENGLSGVFDADVVDGDEHSFEDSFDSGDVSEGDVGVGELAGFDLLVDD